VHNAHFLRRFRAPGNVTKYDSKSIPSIWMEDYCLACRVEGQMMICSSSSSSVSIWLNPPGPGWTISQETPSIVGKTCGRFLPAIFRVPTCALAIPGT
jgi:hypothetical protein